MAHQPTLNLLPHIDTTAVAIGQSAGAHLVLEIEPTAEAIESARPTLSVIFALDVSGSMGGAPLEHVVQSVLALIELLDPADKVGVVAFSSGATEVSGVETLTQDNKRLLRRRLGRLVASGSTNIEAGLRRAQAMLPPRRNGERQLILLLSDGAPNIGISDPKGLAALAESMRPQITISTLGFGQHHSEDLLHAVSIGGAGDYTYIADPIEADFEFARILGTQGDVVADAVEVIIQPALGVEVAQPLSPHKVRFGAGGLHIALPNVVQGRKQYVVIPLTVGAQARAGTREIGLVTLRHCRAGQSHVHTQSKLVQVDVSHQTGPPAIAAQARVLLAQAEQARRTAREHADRGNFDAAAAVTRAIIEAIERAPAYRPDDGSDLSEALEQLIDEAMAYERRPDREQYQNFRRVAMGMDMQHGGAHHSDHAAISARSVAVTDGILGSGGTAWIEVDGQHVPLRAQTTIGRVKSNDICLPTSSVSKRQARIINQEGRYIMVDLKSTNGCYINGHRVGAPTILKHGDKIHIGNREMVFHQLRDK